MPRSRASPLPERSARARARLAWNASAVLDVAFDGAERVIDAGDVDGRLFFNVAGIGLDARVAHRFAMDGLGKRGFSRYIAITLRELFRYEPTG